jgi:N-acylneuraminate cytidylyltransferase
MRDCLAIIPARGGSKRIPKKNIREFFGRPVLEYAIRAAQESGCFSDVMVSTDSPEIAAVAEKCGADVPFLRSANNSDDFATTVDVLREVIDSHRDAGRTFDTGCCIYPVTPFLRAARLREAMNLLASEDAPETVLAALCYPHPVQRAFGLENGRVRLLFPDQAQTRTQDLAPAFHDAAQFYAFRTAPLLASGRLIGPESAAIVLPFEEAHDIDTPEDWADAELKYRLLREKQRA